MSMKNKHITDYYKWYEENGYYDITRQIRKDHKDKKCSSKKIESEKPENFINDKRVYYRQVYLKSDHWKELRSKKIKSKPNCEKCCKKTSLDVHHLNYKNLYDVELEDLQVLCRRCHAKEHEKEKLKKVTPKKNKVANSPKEEIIYDFKKEMDKLKDEKVNENAKTFLKRSISAKIYPSNLSEKQRKVQKIVKKKKDREINNDKYIKDLLNNLNK